MSEQFEQEYDTPGFSKKSGDAIVEQNSMIATF